MHKAIFLLKKIPKGKVVSYKELAHASHSSPRAVGQLLKRNPRPDLYPCYKVIKSSGDIGGYSGQIKGPKITKKIRLLKKDGIKIINNKIEKTYFFEFK